MPRRRYDKIGSFEMSQPVMRVSDPCYDRDVWCTGLINNCLTGKWNAAIALSDEGEWGKRVAMLIVRHETAPAFAAANGVFTKENGDGETVTIYWPGDTWERLDAVIGVDSGQCGLFDEAKYNDSSLFDTPPEHDYGSRWYGHCCDLTLSKRQAGVIPCGAVSSSGYGDGSYNALYHENKDGNVDMVCILYI